MDISRPDLKLKKRRRQFVYVGAGILTLIAIAFGLSAIEPAAPKVARAQVWIDAVKRGEMKREVRGPGTLVPKEVRWIAAETAARVDRFLVKPGALVSADTVIMELSNPEVMDQLLAARSEVTAAEADHAALRMSLESQVLDQRANMAGIEADYESARLQAEAEDELNQKGIISDINFRRSELTAERLKVRLDIEQERIAKFKDTMAAQLAAGRARIEQLRNTLALRERQADSLKLKAGIDGVLQQVPVEVGQQVAPGTNLARVARPDVLIAELRVAETQAKDVVIGQKVAVDTRNGIVEGLVARIDPAVLNGTVQVDVDLVGALPAGARPDLSIDGTIEIERLADVLYVGRPAYGQPESDTTLFRLDAKSGIATRVPVKLGRASVTVIEVSRGLAEGDQVVLSDTAQWDKYDRLKLQ
ncbi:MAG: HlyD family efflux transporter periplasmic adaptor subunit [Xanthomonadales bacterium]|nr:HlyD family efflux transporter periplasmic adaptor subunit [Xanthomonadales bacterium]MCC6563060.1 HlyD family efflux transporter periplasmic adaptor subunit [Xanthomonadales bacterium]